MNAGSQSRRENVLPAHVTVCRYAQKASGGHARQVMNQSLNTRLREPVNPAPNRGTGAAECSGNVADTVAPVQYQHGSQSAGIIFIVCFMDGFLHQVSFVKGNWCYDRHCSVWLVICFDLAIDQIAQSGLSSLKVIYYSAQLFSSTSIESAGHSCSFIIVLNSCLNP